MCAGVDDGDQLQKLCLKLHDPALHEASEQLPNGLGGEQPVTIATPFLQTLCAITKATTTAVRVSEAERGRVQFMRQQLLWVGVERSIKTMVVELL